MVYLYCDGAIEPKNPGGHAVGGWVVKSESGRTMGLGARSFGSEPDVTNNVAEYGAVKTGLQELIKKGMVREPVIVRSDSELIIKQLNNQYACRNPILRAFRDEVFMLLEDFSDDVTFEWVPREQNTDADAASRMLYVDNAPYDCATWFEFDNIERVED